jgi:hypothetical protein
VQPELGGRPAQSAGAPRTFSLVPPRRVAAVGSALLALTAMLAALYGGALAAAATPQGIPAYPDLITSPPSDLRWDTIDVAGTTHHVLRFSNAVTNVGEGALELRGDPVLSDDVFQRVYDDAGGSSDVLVGQDFVFHPEHNHFHFADFAQYELWRLTDWIAWNDSGRASAHAPVREGVKASFCVLDEAPSGDRPGAPPRPVYAECAPTIQGLSVGWADVYKYNLDDQWIDVGQTPLADGQYVVRSIADPLNKVYESAGKSDPARESELRNEATTTFTVDSGAPPEDRCLTPANEIACENSKPGNPASEWDIARADETLVGFATDMSVDQGETVGFKIKTEAADYRIDVYRIGYYGGDGARKVATLAPTVPLPQSQPACLTEAATGLVDCGNWAVSASWAVPADAVSGVYVAKLTRPDTGGENHILFIVRDDDGGSDLIFQTADTTWQAYNRYGGNSLYLGQPAGRAYKVSYNRPLTAREYANHSTFFSGEYPLVRWLERNGYDISYTSGVDTDRRGSELLEHSAFISAGHDEYWSGAQRANVEAARNAGVHVAFFSANQIFWKTRWEQSIDGSGTSHRTLVSYKETKANAKIDPDPAWTGTWRDARFSPPSDGGRPENSLTGTLFGVNGYREDAITVPAADGKLRLWRHTTLPLMPAGGVATFPAGTLGYEWDEDIDNGHRPPGLVRLSTTTVDVHERLIDNGTTYVPGPATHHLTLYKHASGSLVFGAGTTQWGWGLDSNHDHYASRPPTPPDSRMQQATVNVLADMGVGAATLQAGLIAATQSTDTAAPTSVITSPAPAARILSGTSVTIEGTATDSGGRVGAVEVSVDGGASWHPAVGRETWSYTWKATGAGPVTLKSRAADDSANLETPAAGTGVVVTCPCSIWPAATRPGEDTSADPSSVELGVKFRSDAAGYITAVRFYKGNLNTGTHIGSLWTSTGTLLARAPFSVETGSGWQQVTFDAPVPINAGTTYVASYHAPNGRYAIDRPYFDRGGTDRAPLHALASGVDGGNGVFAYSTGPAFPTQTHQAANYWVDVVFADSVPADTDSPTVTSTSPAAGSAGADTRGAVTATFSEAMDAATISSASFELRRASGALVPATVSYDPSTRAATLDPTAALDYEANYTATVKSAAKDRAGNSLAADHTWSFTTAARRDCPCSIFAATAVPDVVAVGDSSAVELGVKFRTDLPGFITGIRFYKGAGNTGTHVGSLWSSTGNLLSRVTFSGESASGWQEASFEFPVPVGADTTYVASYHAPNGRYAVTRPYFGAGVDNAPLRALPDGLDGGNGLYRYSTTSAFPGGSYQASNYWVDLVFATSAPSDTTPPTVVSRVPGPGATEVDPATSLTATFSEPIDPASVDGTSFVLRDPSGAQVPADVSYDGTTRRATLDPTGRLSRSATYTATLAGGPEGVTDARGNPLESDVTWSFDTTPCPCAIWSAAAIPDIASSADTSAVELGVRFRSDLSGYVTGVRFYKGGLNTGQHIGSLWTSSGTLLARAPFTGESASGWQQLRFDLPVAVTAGTTYVVSYHAPRGRYSVSRPYFDVAGIDNPPLHALRDGFDGGNGVFSYGNLPTFPTRTSMAGNYWVDLVFVRALSTDTTPPAVVDPVPAPGATGADRQTAVTVAFDEAMDAASVSGESFELRDATGAKVAASVGYSASVRRATLTPAAPLTPAMSYTATVKSGVRDAAGNPLAANYSWSFTTAAGRPCPCSIWPETARPDTESMGDTSAVELGVKFRADVAGTVTGIRFYKGPANTGTHVGSLWTAGGTLLGRVTFTGESASGWQQASFATPVAIAAGTTYVASYFAPVGRYARNRPFFDSAGVDNPPLRALRDGLDGGNGLFDYSGTPRFPTRTSLAANYWVDVVFTVP